MRSREKLTVNYRTNNDRKVISDEYFTNMVIVPKSDTVPISDSRMLGV
jgi:hypothetical protein